MAEGLFANPQEKAFVEIHSAFLDRNVFRQLEARLIGNIGCGKGTHSIPLEQKGYRIVNIDRSMDALLLTKAFYEQHGINPLLVRADMMALPFRDDTLDGVMNFGVMEHFQNIEPPYAEMIRVLKPGGVFHSEIVTDRLSLYRLERAFNKVVFASFHPNLVLSKIRQRLRQTDEVVKERHALSENFFENTYPLQTYVDAVRRLGISHIKSRGIRAVPWVWLPSPADRLYAKFMRVALPSSYSNRFAESGFAKRWCPVWLVVGQKKTTGQTADGS